MSLNSDRYSVVSNVSRQPTANVGADAYNSTFAPLLAGQTFTGIGDDAYAYASVSCAIKTDQACTLYLEFSTNNTNWDHVKSFSILPNLAEIHSCLVLARYFRIKVTCGATDMGYLRCQSILHASKSVDTKVASAQQSIDEGHDIMLSRNITDYDFDLRTGKFQSRSMIKIIAYAEKMKLDTEEMVRDESGTAANPANFPTAAQTVRIKAGGSANDTTAGVGARQVLVWGLDEEWEPAEELIATAGALASAATTTTFIRVFGARVTLTGTFGALGATNAIQIETSTGAIQAVISAGQSKSNKALYTVPKGSTCYLKTLSVSSPNDRMVYYKLKAREDANNVGSAPFKCAETRLNFASQGAYDVTDRYMLSFPEYTDIYLDAKAEGQDAKPVSASIELLQVTNAN